MANREYLLARILDRFRELAELPQIGGGNGFTSAEMTLQNILDVVRGWEPSGAIPDPLEIGAVEAADYIAVGTDPASTGAIRLTVGEAVVSDDGSGNDSRLAYLDETKQRWQLDPDTWGMELFPFTVITIVTDPAGTPLDRTILEFAENGNTLRFADHLIQVDMEELFITLDAGVVISDSFIFNRITETPDDELSNGSVSLWFDPANGASKLMIKGKSLNGTVVVGEVALA